MAEPDGTSNFGAGHGTLNMLGYQNGHINSITSSSQASRSTLFKAYCPQESSHAGSENATMMNSLRHKKGWHAKSRG